MKYAYCHRSGEITISDTELDTGLLFLGSGDDDFVTRLKIRARHAYDGKTYLVPNVPEAANEEDAVTSVHYFKDWVNGGNAKDLMKEYDMKGVQQRAFQADFA